MNVHFLSPAEKELGDAVRFYESKAEGLGLRFLNIIEKSLEMLIRFPELGVKITETRRRWLVPQFPFALIYEIEKDKILILAVSHLRRRPEYWKKR